MPTGAVDRAYTSEQSPDSPPPIPPPRSLYTTPLPPPHHHTTPSKPNVVTALAVTPLLSYSAPCRHAVDPYAIYIAASIKLIEISASYYYSVTSPPRHDKA
ncbi:hypothetical protein M0802_013206 [Mischocyttarus mexicanus]|nr:hypothetical protein M0802_013206 [Mischocyttarus mexicanus]